MKFVVLVCSTVMVLLLGFTEGNANESYKLSNSTNLAKPGCEKRCGDLIVPYPFGIINGSNSNNSCSINKGFDIYCNTAFNPPRASFTRKDYASIIQISDSTLRTSNLVASNCLHRNLSSKLFRAIYANYTSWPYTFSEVNKFIVIGCDGYAWLTSGKDRGVSTGCMVYCSQLDKVVGDECSGNGCCRSSTPRNMKYYDIQLGTLRSSSGTSNTTSSSDHDSCTYAFVGEEEEFKFKGAADLKARDTNATFNSFVNKIESSVPLVLEWAIGNMTCAELLANRSNIISNNINDDFGGCQGNSTCVDSNREAGGYRCACQQGYQGNPYLPPGCQDIDECSDPKNFPCYNGSSCVNSIGNYTCKCQGGYSGDGKFEGGCRHKPFNVLHLLLGLGLGFLSLLIGLLVLHLIVKQRKLIKLREQLFEQNGGKLLEDKLKTTGRGVMKIFQVEELEEASDHYAAHNILGRGGNGTVYKGTLPDGRVVAIKKSQRLDQEQRDQFINEMVILAQINHPNVVQLLGCCLETDVPLLAYEFISNDTLYHHIQHATSGKGRLSWDGRLRIAYESASALAYLHTDARMSIIHRDVKSTNILLDDNYTAKIADFGASRLVPLGDDQVTTLVQGTIGYLDPEYFHTGQLTGKSDVYSFGVVFAELLTGKKPIDPKRGFEDRNLATYFLKAKKENRLLEILDHHVIKEATDEQLKAACDLVRRCLNQVGGNRPSMKEVAIELETLRKSSKHHPWVAHENYTETSSLMVETEERDLYTVPLVANSDTFGEYSSSTTGMKEIMLQVQSPR